PAYSGYHLYYPSRRQPTPAFALLLKRCAGASYVGSGSKAALRLREPASEFYGSPTATASTITRAPSAGRPAAFTTDCAGAAEKYRRHISSNTAKSARSVRNTCVLTTQSRLLPAICSNR